jgi:DNA-binding NtrC family response regulator
VLDPSAVAALEAHHWPGNVRELRNVMERATLLADGPVLRADDIVITERDRFLTPGIGMAAVVEGEKVRRREGELPTSPHSHIPTSSPPAAPAIGTISIPESGLSLAEIEREAIRLTMLHTAGNLSAAARILGISRPTLTRRLRESGLTRRSLLASK